MESGHYIEKCVHGIVLSQCRCPGPRTEYVIECPPSCGPKSVVEIEDLRTLLAQRDARIAELEKDRERLDWLDSGEITLIVYDREKTEKRSAREVIDAAIAAAKGE